MSKIVPKMRIISDYSTGDVWEFENEWTKNLFDVCANSGNCMFGFLLFPCFLARQFQRGGENLLATLCFPCTLVTLRTKVRAGFRIDGSICEDCLASTCCPCCAVLQIANELNQQGV